MKTSRTEDGSAAGAALALCIGKVSRILGFFGGKSLKVCHKELFPLNSLMIPIPMTNSCISPLLYSAIMTFVAFPVGAQDLEGLTWSEQKCVLYDRAVEAALSFQGLYGLREEFLSENQSFIDGGCQSHGNVCPITDAEIELADLLTIMTMNEGMASTFVPFSCR